MITGRVRNREAVIEVEVAGLDGTPQRSEAIIDTGFNGSLTLPSRQVSLLKLRFAGHRRGMLADGSVARLEVYMATVVWHGRYKEVLVVETEGSPLVGMSLLEGSCITLSAIEAGNVVIEELSA